MPVDYENLTKEVYHYVLKRAEPEEAADIAQEVVMRTWQREASLRNPHAFALRCARNLLVDHYRLRDKYRLESLPEEDPVEQNDMKTIPAPLRQEDRLLERAFLRMVAENVLRTVHVHCTRRQEDVVHALLIDGYNTAEAAAKLNTTEGALKALYHRARYVVRQAANPYLVEEFRREYSTGQRANRRH